AGEGKHRRAEVQPGEGDLGRVVRQVQAGADRHLECLATGLAADPVPAVLEQVPVPEAHFLVVASRVLVPGTLPWIGAVLRHTSSLSAGPVVSLTGSAGAAASRPRNRQAARADNP